MERCQGIMVILLEQRNDTAAEVQQVLTEYGCHIRVRLGLHDAGVEHCSNAGMILLQLCGEQEPLEAMKQKLLAIATVKVKYMALDF